MKTMNPVTAVYPCASIEWWHFTHCTGRTGTRANKWIALDAMRFCRASHNLSHNMRVLIEPQYDPLNAVKCKHVQKSA
jgi:hypothetical protein